LGTNRGRKGKRSVTLLDQIKGKVVDDEKDIRASSATMACERKKEGRTKEGKKWIGKERKEH